MTRTIAVTGSASGIGRATKAALEATGARVIGIDLMDADAMVDLAAPGSRAQLAEKVSALAPDGLDAIVAVAGVSAPSSLTVRVNYFGALATLANLRVLLRSETPRAAAVTSFATIFPVDDELMVALRAGDEPAATARADALANSMDPAVSIGLIYGSSKRALSEWIREQSVSSEWAGAGIPLNGVAPGIIATPMVAATLATPEGRAAMLTGVPMPLNGPAEPAAVADLLTWLVSPQNTHVTGQIIFVDGGADATVRGARIFD